MKKNSGTTIAGLLRHSMMLLQRNDPLRMAGATAFFTIFALPAILVILIQFFGLVFKKEKISSDLLTTLSTIIGNQSAEQVNEILAGLSNHSDNWLITIGGFLFLIFVATNLFVIIKGSVNQLWHIRINKRQRFLSTLKNRMRSILVILFAGIFFLVGLMAESLQLYLGSSIKDIMPAIMPFLNWAFNIFISLVVVSAWFVILYRFLPDGRPTWKIALIGGLVTSILFNAGKWILHFFLFNNSFDSVFGASASIILLLLFVFYSALIFYFGAAFTKILSDHLQEHIKPLSLAINEDD